MNTESKKIFADDVANWTALQYFNVYRTLLASLFAILVYTDQLPQSLGSLDKPLFSIICYVYLSMAIIFNIFIAYQAPHFNRQIIFHVLTDIFMLSLMMYASGGLSSGFGMLIITAIAGGSILQKGKIAILFAALASFAVLGHELYIKFLRYADTVNYMHAGMLGITFFITAIIGNALSAKIRKTEVLAKRQAEKINELAKLNAHIVSRMQSGVIVFDEHMSIILLNESAKHLLQQSGADTDTVALFVQKHMKTHIDAWLNKQGHRNVIIKLQKNIELLVSFIKLHSGKSPRLLIFLEDVFRLRQQAQRLKLVSLGRLAASIAHEVRNPLGAINHAGQLLKESNTLNDEDKRLTEIINTHSFRINTVIENVLSISRMDQATPEQFDIVMWLRQFMGEFRTRFTLPENRIALKYMRSSIIVQMDPSQLYQILWNLCENALNHSKGIPLMTLHCGLYRDTNGPYLDVIDYGNGMSKETQAQLFEPFFTTGTQGSGLGLYLAKEFCEANQARLDLVSSTKNGSVFRLSFMHADD